MQGSTVWGDNSASCAHGTTPQVLRCTRPGSEPQFPAPERENPCSQLQSGDNLWPVNQGHHSEVIPNTVVGPPLREKGAIFRGRTFFGGAGGVSVKKPP